VTPKLLMCSDCGEDFDFSVRDQQRFTMLAYPDPVRCLPCRTLARKVRKNRLKEERTHGEH